ncbi:MAG TPA: histidinol-phosphatase [Acidimicrobiales bacterium]|nr:histidinol-phosphatase [Acidimicrobiales bacterium]
MIDYHVHLWPHDARADSSEQRLERLGEYCEQARSRGVDEIALTEHLFRFTQVQDVARRFWLNEHDEALRTEMASYFEFHATADLDTYVEDVLSAKRAGLPVVLGLEVDYYRGSMDLVERLLSGYPFDVLLGSVHWLGTWMFDNLASEVAMREWDLLGSDSAWTRYTEALEELAATRTCDVLAHPDLIKLTGRRPGTLLLDECNARIAEAARRSGMAAEISSAGLRKPVDEPYPSRDLLRRLFEAGVPVTAASDAHGVPNVADHRDELIAHAQRAGYGQLLAFSGRKGHLVPLVSGDPAR